MTDLDQYLAGIVAGDPRAFASWVAGAEPRVRGNLRSFAARVDTEAVVQETLLRVWQVAPKFKPDGRPDALLRFAMRIARNLAISEVRRARVEPTEAQRLEAAMPPVSPAMPDPMLRELIALCRQKLPARPAAALRQRLLNRGNRPDADLAAAVNMRLNTFLQNVRRARLALADCLAEQGVQLSWGRR